MQFRALVKEDAVLSEKSLVNYCAVGCNKGCQKVIQHAAAQLTHIFEDVLDHLPPDHHLRLSQLRPKAKKSKKETKEERMQRLQKQAAYITKNINDMFLQHRRAHCLLHGSKCRMLWEKLPCIAADTQPLSWEISGPMCTPHTLMGQRLDDSYPSMESWNVWSASAAMSAHDLVTCENCDITPSNMFADRMALDGKDKWFNGFDGVKKNMWHRLSIVPLLLLSFAMPLTIQG